MADQAKVLPIRPHTGHQYRCNMTAARLLRVLKELGGNTRQVRREFAQFALVEAVANGLRLPNVAPGEGRDERMATSLANSLRNLLNGKGNAEWVLDVWDLACATLEAPQPSHLGPTPAHLDAGSTTEKRATRAARTVARTRVAQVQDDDKRLGIQVLADADADAEVAGKGYVPRPRGQRERAKALLQRVLPTDGTEVPYSAIRELAAKDSISGQTLLRARKELGVRYRTEHGARGGGSRTWWHLPKGVAAPAPAPAPPRQPAPQPKRLGTELAARRDAYLDQLQQQALAGDAAAQQRYEELLGLR